VVHLNKLQECERHIHAGVVASALSTGVGSHADGRSEQGGLDKRDDLTPEDQLKLKGAVAGRDGSKMTGL
jgi:hypothetical protein